MKVLLAGISTRTLSQSAVAAGYEVTSLDFFGDRDQPAQARVIALGRDLGQPLTMPALAAATLELAAEADAVMVVSGLENETAFFRLLDNHRLMLNASREAVDQVRDPRILRVASEGTGAFIPRTIQPGQNLPTRGQWLLKDLRHSGGQGVQPWNGKPPLPPGCILQECLEGKLCSLAFASDGKDARVIGLSLQYAGEGALGAPPFAWCGNAVPLVDSAAAAALQDFAQALVERTGLAGINGIDFILSGGSPGILEVNPRPGASIELYEKVLGFNAFQAHVEALQGRLPVFASFKPRLAAARGILYASQDLQVRDHPDWFSGAYGDIPHPGELIPGGAPLCSIYSLGTSTSQCWDAVLNRATGPYRLAVPNPPGF